MIPDLLSHDLIEMLRPVVPLIDVSDAVGGASAPAAASDLAARLVPGQQVTAHVLSGLSEGRFQVLLMNQALDMNLPPSTLPGQTVELTYLGDQPRLTFMLSAHAAQLAATPDVSLSQVARLLARSGQATAPHTPAAPLPPLRALLAGPPSDAAAAAARLAEGLEKSGLFYEAHQAQWVQGQRSLEDLRQEPQARLPVTAPENAAGAAAASASAQPAAREALADPIAQAVRAAALPAAAQGVAGQPPQAASPATLPPGGAVLPGATMPSGGNAVPDATAMAAMRAQMQMLDSGALIWSGPVWPGQQMDWEIMPDEASEGGAPTGRHWRTRLTLSLPQLGSVTAWLTLTPDGGLEVRCQTDNPYATAELHAAAAPLAAQLAGAGLTLTALAVHDG